MVKNILWKYDKELGVAFACPQCKLFICGNEAVCKCGQELDWNNKDEYRGRIKWD